MTQESRATVPGDPAYQHDGSGPAKVRERRRHDDTSALSAPNTKAGRLQRACLDVLREHEANAELPTSTRFVFYELVQASIVDKRRSGARRADQCVVDVVFALRDKGIVPWQWIADETRSLHEWRCAPSVADYVHDLVGAARIDPWDGDVPLILTESRSLAGVLRSLSAEYLCPIAATNGQCGGFLRTEIAPRLADTERPVLYLGDLDQSGALIEQNTRAVLERIVGPLDWQRLAITREQVELYALPSVIKYDRRYRDGGEHEAWETEALRQGVIVQLVRDRLDALLPEPLDAVRERERRQREDVMRLLGGAR